MVNISLRVSQPFEIFCWEFVFQTSTLFFIWSFWFLEHQVLWGMYIFLYIKTLLDVFKLYKYFYHSLDCLFSNCLGFGLKKTSLFHEVQFMNCTISILFRRVSPVTLNSVRFSHYPSVRINVFCFTLNLWKSIWKWVLCRAKKIDLFPYISM